MPMTPRQAWKFGFLLRCADEGCTVEEMNDRLEKAAGLIKQAEGTLSTLGKLPLWMYLIGGGTAAAGGYLTGRTLGSMSVPSISPDEVKDHELTAAYQLQADRARQQAKLRKYREKQAPATPRFFG